MLARSTTSAHVHRQAAESDAALEQEILRSVTRLEDLDTRSAAVSNLELVIRKLNPSNVSLFLNCVCDVDNQCAVARRECMLLVGKTALSHSRLLQNHTPRIKSWLAHGLQDADSRVREACAISVGQLSLNAPVGSLEPMLKIIFHTLARKTPPSQSSAAHALAELLSAAPSDTLLPNLPRLCTALQRHLVKAFPSVQRFLMRTVSSIAQASASKPQALNRCAVFLIAYMTEGIKSEDWKVRRAAASALKVWGSILRESHAVAAAKREVSDVLAKFRFDRVSKVRDEIHSALQVWRRVPLEEAKAELFAEESVSDTKFDNLLRRQSQAQAIFNKSSVPHPSSDEGDGYDSDSTLEIMPFEVAPQAAMTQRNVASWLPESRGSTPSLESAAPNSRLSQTVDRNQLTSHGLCSAQEKRSSLQRESREGSTNRTMLTICRQQRSLLRAMEQLKNVTESGLNNLNERLSALEGRSAMSSRPPSKDAEGLRVSATSKGETVGVWNEALFLAESKQVDAAYRRLLNAGEEMQLVRLMGRTGPTILKELDSNTCKALFIRIVSLAASGNFIDLCFQWFNYALEHDLLHLLPSDRIDRLLNVLSRCMKQLPAEQSAPMSRLYRLLITRLGRTSE